MQDVLSGEQVTSKWVKLAVKRHFTDLTRIGSADFPYHFDPVKANGAISFFNLCHHYQGRSDVIKLEPWQQWFIAMIFGWVDANENRRFTIAMVTCAKKQGKTTIAAGIGLKMERGDREPGAEVYAAASKKDQARKIWDAAHEMVKRSPLLRGSLRVYRHNLTIVHEASSSKFEPVSSDANTLDGLNVHCCLLDEYHQHKDDSVYDILRRGMVSRAQPLFLVISTAGMNIDSPLYPEWEYARDVLEGIRPNDRYFAAIYTIDDDDNWKDPTVWEKANPNLGVSIDREAFEAEYRLALQRPEEESKFRVKNLNTWTQAKEIWIPHDVWTRSQGAVNTDELAGRIAFGAFDLSEKWDVTGWTLCFPPDTPGGQYQFLHRAWIPEEGLYERIKRDRQPYDVWIRSGWLNAIPGERIDQDYIEQQIFEDAKTYDLKEVPYDPYGAIQLVKNLEDAGIPVVEFQQGWKTMSPATKEFEDKVYSGQMSHGENPLLAWMISCVTLWRGQNDQVRPIKPDRGKSRKRIDLVITSIMALSRAIRWVDDRSVYESRGIRTF